MQSAKQHHSIDTLFALILFCVFAMTAVVSAVMGANVYISSSKSAEKTYESRVCLDYITAKVHANGEKGAVSVSEVEGAPALTLSETVDGDPYDTVIYCCGGALRELYSARGIPFSADSGTVIANIQSVDFSIDGNVLTVSCTFTDGRTEKAYTEVIA